MRALNENETHSVRLALRQLLDRDDSLKADGFVGYDDDHRRTMDNLLAELDAGRGLALLP